MYKLNSFIRWKVQIFHNSYQTRELHKWVYLPDGVVQWLGRRSLAGGFSVIYVWSMVDMWPPRGHLHELRGWRPLNGRPGLPQAVWSQVKVCGRRLSVRRQWLLSSPYITLLLRYHFLQIVNRLSVNIFSDNINKNLWIIVNFTHDSTAVLSLVSVESQWINLLINEFLAAYVPVWI